LNKRTKYIIKDRPEMSAPSLKSGVLYLRLIWWVPAGTSIPQNERLAINISAGSPFNKHCQPVAGGKGK
jgi:hypothetical protein